MILFPDFVGGSSAGFPQTGAVHPESELANELPCG